MSLALKIEFPHLNGATKAMRFNVDIPIQQVIKEIKDKIEYQQAQDHGIFQPEVAGKNAFGRWLKENHTLKFYNLANESLVVFKKKHRPLRVRLVDGTIKTVMIDDTTNVGKIRDTVGRKLGINSSEEYGLKVADAKEGVWLKADADLYSQGVKEDDVLLFDKSYFMFDDIIDRSDPIQLHLIYSKAVQSIVQGTYPVTYAEALNLASIQAQATHGDYKPEKHKPGYLNLPDFMPVQWIEAKTKKPKQVEQEIFDEWKKLINMEDINAKYRYVQTVRQLPTYGITFYTVKEPNPKKKNKLTPMLLGITREKILRMDFETKEVVREYLLIHLKRWAAVQGKFTFDFGDHEQDYWTVHTDEAEAISNLIAGYIDIIIMTRKQGVKQIEIDQKIGIATEEEMAVPAVASSAYTIHNMPTGGMQSIQYGSYVAGATPLSSKLSDINSVVQMADIVKSDLKSSRARMTSRGSMAPLPQAQLVDQLVQFENGTDDDVEELVEVVSGGGAVDKTKLEKIATQIGERFGKFANATKGFSNGGDPIVVDTSAELVGALQQVIVTTQKISDNPFDLTLQAELTASKQAYDDHMLLMKAAQLYDLNDDGTVSLITSTSNTVAESVRDLVEATVAAVKEVPTTKQQQQLIMNNFLKQIQPASAALISSASTLAPAAINGAAKQHVIDAAKFLDGLTAGLTTIVNDAGVPPHFVDRIARSAQNINSKVDRLLSTLDTADKRSLAIDLEPVQVSMVSALKNLREAGPNQKKLLDSVKAVVTVANELNRLSLQTAKGLPGDMRSGIESQCAQTKTHLTELTSCGKIAIQHANDAEARHQLLEVAQKIEDDTNALMADVSGATAQISMRMCAKQVVATTNNLVGHLMHCVPPSEPVFKQAVGVDDNMKQFIDSLKRAVSQPDNIQLQEELKSVARTNAAGVAQFVAQVKRSKLTPEAEQKATALAAATQQSLQKLMASIEKTETADTTGTDISGALKDLDANEAQIEAAEFSAQSGLLSAMSPGSSREGSIELLQQLSENLIPQCDNLARAARGNGPLGEIAQTVAEASRDMLTAVEAVSGATDPTTQMNILKASKTLNANLTRLVKASKALRANKTNPQAEEAVKTARSDVTKALADLLNSSKGVDNREAEAAIKQLKAELASVRPVESKSDLKVATQALGQRTKALNAAAQQLANMVKQNPRRVGPASKLVTTTAKQLVTASNTLAGTTRDEKLRQTFISVTKSVLVDLTELIEASKTASATGQMDELMRAADRVGASSAALESAACGSAFPDVDQAVGTIFSELDKLDSTAGKGQGRRAVLENIESAVSTLGSDIQRLVSAAEIGTDKVGVYAKATASSINQIISSAVASKLPIEKTVTVTLDPIVQTIIDQCQEITDDPNNISKVGPATVKIGQAAQDLTKKVRDTANALANDKERQKTYVTASKSLTAAVPKLVNAVKAKKPDLASASAAFIQKALYRLEAARLEIDPKLLSDGPDVQVPAPVQERLLTSARAVGAATTTLLQASAQLAADPSNTLLAEQAQKAATQVTEILENTITTIARELDPAKQEISATADEISKAIVDLDTATVNAGVGLLEKPTGKNYTQLQKELSDMLNSFAPDIRMLQERTGTAGEGLQQSAQRIKQKVPEFVACARDAASSAPSANNAKKLLLQSKHFGSALLNLVNQCYTGEGGDVATEFAKNASDAIGDLLGQLKASDDLLKELDEIVEKVKKMVEVLSQPSLPTGRSYPEIKEGIVSATRSVTSAASALKSCDFSRVGAVGLEAKTLARTLPALLNLVKDAVVTTPDAQTKQRMLAATTALIEGVADLISLARAVSQEDNLVRRAEFSSGFESFTNSVLELLDSVKRGALGESKIDDGAEAISRLLNKLNTCAIFASAGQELEGVKSVDVPFDKQATQLVSAAEGLTNEANSFKEAGSLSQEELGLVVEKLSHAVGSIIEAALSASEKAPSAELTQAIISAGKAVAISAKQLVLSSKDVQKNPTDKTGQAVLDSAVTHSFPRAVSTFVAVVKGDSGGGSASAAGFRQLDSVKREIEQSLTSSEIINSATAVSVLDAARSVAQASTPIVFSSSPDELVDGANRGLRAIEDLLAHVRGVAKTNPTVGAELSENAKGVAVAMSALIDVTKSKNSPNSESLVSSASSSLNESLEQLVQSINKLPGGTDLKLTSVVDLEATTNKELAAAADLIRTALTSLPKRATASVGGASSAEAIRVEDIINEESLNDAIVVTARNIAEATGKLVYASQQAQIERGKNAQAKARYHKDPTWGNGLISAAQKAAAGVNRLVNCANNSVAGKVEEEQLMADARYVAACVKQLMVAARVKEDIDVQLQDMILKASKDIAKTTSEILAVAQKAGDFKEQKESKKRRASTKFGVAGSIVQKLEQQAAILRLEKQLEDARKGLSKMNAADYRSVAN